MGVLIKGFQTGGLVSSVHFQTPTVTSGLKVTLPALIQQGDGKTPEGFSLKVSDLKMPYVDKGYKSFYQEANKKLSDIDAKLTNADWVASAGKTATTTLMNERRELYTTAQAQGEVQTELRKKNDALAKDLKGDTYIFNNKNEVLVKYQKKNEDGYVLGFVPQTQSISPNLEIVKPTDLFETIDASLPSTVDKKDGHFVKITDLDQIDNFYKSLNINEKASKTNEQTDKQINEYVKELKHVDIFSQSLKDKEGNPFTKITELKFSLDNGNSGNINVVDLNNILKGSMPYVLNNGNFNISYQSSRGKSVSNEITGLRYLNSVYERLDESFKRNYNQRALKTLSKPSSFFNVTASDFYNTNISNNTNVSDEDIKTYLTKLEQEATLFAKDKNELITVIKNSGDKVLNYYNNNKKDIDNRINSINFNPNNKGGYNGIITDKQQNEVKTNRIYSLSNKYFLSDYLSKLTTSSTVSLDNVPLLKSPGIDGSKNALDILNTTFLNQEGFLDGVGDIMEIPENYMDIRVAANKENITLGTGKTDIYTTNTNTVNFMTPGDVNKHGGTSNTYNQLAATVTGISLAGSSFTRDDMSKIVPKGTVGLWTMYTIKNKKGDKTYSKTSPEMIPLHMLMNDYNEAIESAIVSADDLSKYYNKETGLTKPLGEAIVKEAINITMGVNQSDLLKKGENGKLLYKNKEYAGNETFKSFLDVVNNLKGEMAKGVKLLIDSKTTKTYKKLTNLSTAFTKIVSDLGLNKGIKEGDIYYEETNPSIIAINFLNAKFDKKAGVGGMGFRVIRADDIFKGGKLNKTLLSKLPGDPRLQLGTFGNMSNDPIHLNTGNPESDNERYKELFTQVIELGKFLSKHDLSKYEPNTVGGKLYSWYTGVYTLYNSGQWWNPDDAKVFESQKQFLTNAAPIINTVQMISEMKPISEINLGERYTKGKEASPDYVKRMEDYAKSFTTTNKGSSSVFELY